MRRRLSAGLASVIGTVAVGVLLLAGNALADRFLAGRQLDLTQGRSNTLSRGTRQILAALPAPVTLSLYVSRDLAAASPPLAAYADRVGELLESYVIAAHGRLRLVRYDPEPFSDVEDRAEAAGLQGVPVGPTREKVFFGLAGVNALDDMRALPFLDPGREPFLEYDLSRIVYELGTPKRPVVGVLSPLRLAGDAQLPPYVAMEQLQRAFTVRPVAANAQVIDPDVQVLLVAGAQGLPDATLYAIDQYVMRGGHLLAMVDPHSEAEAALPEPPRSTESDLRRLFEAWGIGFDPDRVVGDLAGAWRVPSPSGVVDYPPWFLVGHDGIARDDPATGDLDQVGVASAGFLIHRPSAVTEFLPLLQSSTRSGVLDARLLRTDPDPAAVLAAFHPDGGPYVLAARLRGMLHSAFDAPPPPPPGEARLPDLPDYVARTAAPANLVAVADTDVLSDRFWVREDSSGSGDAIVPFADNGAFVVNLVGTLAGGDALLGLRARRGGTRPLALIRAMQQDAEQRYQNAEQQLQAHLADTRRKLDDLRTGRGGDSAGRVILTEQQGQAIDDLTREVVDTRTHLRHVQLDLRREVDALEDRIRLANTLAVPTLLAVAAVAVGVRRNRRGTGRRSGERPA